jgi:lysophospholipase L1-like esterase
MRRSASAVLAALALAACADVPAQAWFTLGLDSTEPGQIAFWTWGSGTFTSVDIVERVQDSDVPVRSVTPPPVLTPDGNVITGARFARSTPWRCDRLTRSFTATGHRADGSVETSTAELRTPSCRRRVALIAPRRARLGPRVPVRVRDRFHLGGIAMRLCVRGPRAPRRCRTLRLARGRTTTAYRFRVRRRGHWSVSLATPHQRQRTVVSVGVRPPARLPRLPVVLTTGDSLMEGVDALLGDRLTDRAHMRGDVHPGSGLTNTFFVSWSKLPAAQVRRYRPAATIVFLGTNDAWPVTTAAGDAVPCCGEEWIAEYAHRARRAMKAYLRRRGGVVIWMNVPATKDPKRKASNDAVNAGLARAVAGLDRAAVLDMAALFTPGGVYREYMTDRGASVRVRQADGIHLSTAGAAIAVRAVVAQLERFGVI